MTPPQACDRDEDCTHALRSRCDLTKHECAPCTTSAQCSRVSDAPVCIAGVGCFPCSDTDTSKCPSGRTLCEPTTHQCVKCVDTINETTCAGGQHCLDNECVQCRNAMDCPLATASVCNAQHQCEGCQANGDCDQIANKTLCNTGEHTCVSCLSNADCTDPDKPICDGGACRPCTTDGDCTPLGKICDEADGPHKGQCVQCTQAAADEARCGTKSCDPATRTCTQTERGSVGICEACVADSECKADHRCISMSFQGNQLDGGFCLKRGMAAGGCAQPFAATPINRESLSGAPAEAYCGIVESRSSCAAILALVANKSCPSGDASECGAPGARCESVNLAPHQCTYSCGGGAECPDFALCPTNGADKYCGQ